MLKFYQASATRSGRWWVISVPDLPGVITQGRDWPEALAMTRDAIATVLDCPESELIVELKVAIPGVTEALDELAEVRRRLSEARNQEALALEAAARALTEEGITVRDAALLLGIPYQRISGLTGARKRSGAENRDD